MATKKTTKKTTINIDNIKRSDLKNLKLPHIIDWCKKNDRLAWLKEHANRQVEYFVYPKVEGKKGRMVYDKDQEPIDSYMDKISFMELKQEFITECLGFEPEPVEEKPTFIDIINSL